MMKSWVWTHFEKVDKDFGICNFCDEHVSRGGGTTALERHLKKIHGMPNPRFSGLSSPKIEKPRALKPIVNKPIVRRTSEPVPPFNSDIEIIDIKEEESMDEEDTYVVYDNIATLMSDFGESSKTKTNNHQTKTGSIAIMKDTSFRPSLNSVKKDNCYVCDKKLSSCRTKLSFVMDFLETPIYEILESFTGSIVEDDIRDEAVACHNCVVSFEKFDDLQRQVSEIQTQLTQKYCQTHEDVDCYDDEDDDDDEDEELEIEEEEHNENSNESLWLELPEYSESTASFLSKETGLTKGKGYFCQTCNKHFNKTCYELHLTTDHEAGTGPFQCSKCTKLCKDIDSLKQHYVTHSLQASMDLMKKPNSFGDLKKYICSIPGCKKRFPNSFKLQSHLKVHFDIKNYSCSMCGKKFTEKFELNAHLKYKHESSVKNDGGRIMLNREGVKRSVMRKRIHINDKRHLCFFPGCTKRFVTNFKLRSHIRVHKGEKPFECNFCGKRFTEKFELNAHQRKKHQTELNLDLSENFLSAPASVDDDSDILFE